MAGVQKKLKPHDVKHEGSSLILAPEYARALMDMEWCRVRPFYSLITVMKRMGAQ